MKPFTIMPVFGTGARLLIWPIIALGVILHFTVRDQAAYLDGIFYALPLPVLVGLAFLVGLLPCKLRRGRRTNWLVTMSLLCLWLGRSFCWHQPDVKSSDSGRELTLLYWNLNRPLKPSTDLIDVIRRLKPDIVGCGEPGPRFMTHEAVYEAALPGYDCQISPVGLLMFTRLPAKPLKWGALNRRGVFSTHNVTAPSGDFRLIISDVHSDPFRSRRKSLEETMTHAAGDPRSIIMGDFNTPLESAWFDPYREQLQHAFTAGGRGLRETWFFRLPVLCIDHIWIGKGWRVLDTQKIQRWSSDHDGLFVRLQPAP